MSRVGYRYPALLVFTLAALFAFAPSLFSQDNAEQAAPAQGSQDPLKRPLTDKQKKDNSKSLKQELSKTYKRCLDEDGRYIISNEEHSAFRTPPNDEDRDNFTEPFWKRRDAAPDPPENEFKDEHYRRMAYANEHFP